MEEKELQEQSLEETQQFDPEEAKQEAARELSDTRAFDPVEAEGFNLEDIIREFSEIAQEEPVQEEIQEFAEEDTKEDTEEETAETGLPEIQDRTDKVTFGEFKFLVNGNEVTNDTLAGLSIYKITVNVENSKGVVSEATYTGYRLSDVLAACGITEFDSVIAVADDGYESVIDYDTANSEYTLLAIEKDKETGEGGTVWVAPCMENTSGSYIKLVVEIKTV